jgi:hypothetical protein
MCCIVMAICPDSLLLRREMIMRSCVAPDTFSSRMATYQSSGLKIQIDGRLCTLFKDRRD